MTGPYAYVRNPLYLGSIVIGIGFAIAARDLWVAAVLVIYFAVVYVPVIRGEENFLSGRFRGLCRLSAARAEPAAALAVVSRSDGGIFA